MNLYKVYKHMAVGMMNSRKVVFMSVMDYLLKNSRVTLERKISGVPSQLQTPTLDCLWDNSVTGKISSNMRIPNLEYKGVSLTVTLNCQDFMKEVDWRRDLTDFIADPTCRATDGLSRFSMESASLRVGKYIRYCTFDQDIQNLADAGEALETLYQKRLKAVKRSDAAIEASNLKKNGNPN